MKSLRTPSGSSRRALYVGTSVDVHRPHSGRRGTVFTSDRVTDLGIGVVGRTGRSVGE